MMEFLSDSKNWVLISFILFAFLLWKVGRNVVLKMLDDRIEKIRYELATAENLRVEAQELLAQYQRKHRDAAKEAENIVKNAEEHAKTIRKQAEEELKESIAHKEKQLDDRLERMQQSAILEIQRYAADLAIEATREIIAENLDEKTIKRLQEDALQNVSKELH